MNISLKPILHSSYFKEPSGLNLVGEDRIRLVNIVDGVEIDVIGPYLNLWDCDNLVSGLISKEFLIELLDNLFETYSPVTSLIFDNEWVNHKNFWSNPNGDYYMTVEFSLPSEFGTPVTYDYPNLRDATFESDGVTTVIHFMNDNPDFNRARIRVSRSSGVNTEVVIDPVNLDNSSIIKSELSELEDPEYLLSLINEIQGLDLVSYGDLSEYISFTSYVTEETQNALIWQPINYDNVQLRALNLKGFYPNEVDNNAWYQGLSQVTVEVPRINPDSDILNLEIKYLKSGIIDNVTYPDTLNISTYVNNLGERSNITYSRTYVDLYKSTLTNEETGNFEVINFDGSPVSYGDILEYCISVSLAINKFDGSSFIMNLGDLSLEYSSDGIIIFPNVEGIQEYFISKCTVLKIGLA